MEYQTLYRRWRPRGFHDFVGQKHVMTTLAHALETKRVAHAYLFTGPRGTGKTSTAKILAKALNCEASQGVEPCDRCLNCTRINEGIFMDVIEIDAASNRGIDEIRDLREKVKFAPTEGKYKIYIIDEVHMLTTEAFNALLKTLEEPPQFVVFILATTEVHKLPLTIISRCQRFDFKRFTVAEITGRLTEILTAEGIDAEPAALELIAKYAEGGMRDALSLLEQALAYCGERLLAADVRAILGLCDEEAIERLTLAVRERNTEVALAVLDEVSQGGKDLFQFGRSLIEHFRELLLQTLTGAATDAGAPEDLVTIIETLAAATYEVKRSFQSTLPLELALIKLTALREPDADLAARVTRLEEMLRQGVVPPQDTPGVVPGRTAYREKPAVSPKPPLAAQPGAASVPAPMAANVAGGAKAGSGFADWENFLEAVKARKRTVAALIQEGKPLDFSAGKLTIGFPPHLKFHLDNLSLPQNQALLEEVFQNQYGQAVKICCLPFSAVTEAAAKPTAKPQADPDALTRAVAMFGGEAKPLIKEDKAK
ncbi:MAG: DNA polymerase III subunit gamma/tau [Bacillota bacterium]|jgi:DNA polymerase-3 subunit gamma/tau